jgi:predicted secreted Zn-dependent protease
MASPEAFGERYIKAVSLCARFFRVIFMLLLLSSPVIAEVSETITYKTYTAEHKTGTTLLQALNSSSPIRHNGEIFHGYTSWYIRWRYEWNHGTDGYCSITRNKTTLRVTITLPDLIASDPKIKSEFSRYLESLHGHELGHLRIAREAAERIDREILSLPPMASCSLLEQTANQAGQEILEQARQEERNYDQSTNYGATQGALLPR